MMQNNHGFTLIEIIIVLVLISIISVTVFSRSLTTDRMTLVGEVAKVRNHIRYPQSMAMKRGEFWGFRCDTNDYWIFSGTNPAANQKILPGQAAMNISLDDLGVTMDGFTVFFDEFGRPFWNDPSTPIAVHQQIVLTDTGSESQSIRILGETGYIK